MLKKPPLKLNTPTTLPNLYNDSITEIIEGLNRIAIEPTNAIFIYGIVKKLKKIITIIEKENKHEFQKIVNNAEAYVYNLNGTSLDLYGELFEHGRRSSWLKYEEFKDPEFDSLIACRIIIDKALEERQLFLEMLSTLHHPIEKTVSKFGIKEEVKKLEVNCKNYSITFMPQKVEVTVPETQYKTGIKLKLK